MSALLTLEQIGGSAGVQDIHRGVITIPRIGAWHASLWLDATVAPQGRVELVAGALTMRGTVHRASVYQGVVRLRIVGGADGLRTPARPRHYTSPTARLVLADLCAGAGETMATPGDTAVLGALLLAWTTIGIETGAMVQLLAHEIPNVADAAWRVLTDGTIWVGRETWPDSGLTDYREIEEGPEDAWVVLGMDHPHLLPGTTFGGRKAEVVEHVVTPDEYRAKVWLAP